MSSLALAKIESLTGNTSISVSSAGQATFEHVISQPGSFMFRNKLINGNFDIWQRGTSQTISGYGSADRWVCSNAESTKTASRQAFDLGQMDVPGNPKYFMRHVVTSVAGSGNQVHMYQNIEGVSTLAGKTATLSFWAKADSNKNIAVEFAQVFGTGGSPSSAITAIESQLISLSSSWTKYTVTVNIPSISGKTLGSDGNNHAGVIFWFDAGSNFNVRAANLGQQSGTFDIAQVQIEEGAVATPFEQRPIGVELGLCQRYYWKWTGDQFVRVAFGYSDSTTNTVVMYQLPCPMRAVPSISMTNMTVNGTAITASSVAFINNNIVHTNVTASGRTSGTMYQIYTASGSTGTVELSAEL